MCGADGRGRGLLATRPATATLPCASMSQGGVNSPSCAVCTGLRCPYSTCLYKLVFGTLLSIPLSPYTYRHLTLHQERTYHLHIPRWETTRGRRYGSQTSPAPHPRRRRQPPPSPHLPGRLLLLNPFPPHSHQQFSGPGIRYGNSRRPLPSANAHSHPLPDSPHLGYPLFQ